MQTKRIAALILACLMSVSTFAGCKSSGTSSTDTTEKTTQIKAYFLAPKCTGLSEVQDKVNAITEKDINFTVQLNYLDFDSYADKTKLLLQSGDSFDLMLTAGWESPTYQTYVGQSALKPLDDLLNKYGSAIKEQEQDGYFKSATINGKIYGIPTNRDNAGVTGFVINKKLAEKYNMDFSKFSKPSDIIPYLEIIKKNEPGITPFVSSSGNTIPSLIVGDYYNTDVTNNLGVPTDGNTKVVNTFDDSRFMDSVKTQREIFLKDLTNKDAATCQNLNDYKNNQKAFCWTEMLKPGKADEMTASLGYDVIQVNGYGADQKPTHSTGTFIGSMLSIPNSSTHAEAAMKFINELYANKDVQNLLAWGIEGKNYVKMSDGRIKLPDGVTSETNTYTGIYAWAMGGNQMNDYLFETESLDKWTKMKEFNESAINNPLVGFNPDTSSIQNEIAALTTVSKQYYPSIETGSVDLDSVKDKYFAAEKAAGFDTCKQELQKQIDAFLKNNK
jgi:putative aldouronate transport system substrate-binding protein